jgi:formiminotetrahydrofolate cyclodeaminase
MQLALRGATDVPRQVMRMSSEALHGACAVAERCHRPASSDVRVAIGLIRAGLTGARSSAEANLAVLTNSAYVERARAEIEELSLDAARAADAAEQSLASRS